MSGKLSELRNQATTMTRGAKAPLVSWYISSRPPTSVRDDT